MASTTSVPFCKVYSAVLQSCVMHLSALYATDSISEPIFSIGSSIRINKPLPSWRSPQYGSTVALMTQLPLLRTAIYHRGSHREIVPSAKRLLFIGMVMTSWNKVRGELAACAAQRAVSHACLLASDGHRRSPWSSPTTPVPAIILNLSTNPLSGTLTASTGMRIG